MASPGRRFRTSFRISASIADDICIVRSMHTEQINHDPAHAFMNTGSIIKGRPSMGSWLLYGIGAETENLPGFVVLTSAAKPVSNRFPRANGRMAFCRANFRGSSFSPRAMRFIMSATRKEFARAPQRQVVEEIKRLNGMLAEERIDPEIQTRISQYEMAFGCRRPFRSSPISAASHNIFSIFMACKHPGDGSFASNCLLARRLAERGVRFIQLYHRAWDHHGEIERDMPVQRRTWTRLQRRW